MSIYDCRSISLLKFLLSIILVSTPICKLGISKNHPLIFAPINFSALINSDLRTFLTSSILKRLFWSKPEYWMELEYKQWIFDVVLSTINILINFDSKPIMVETCFKLYIV